MTGPPGRPLRAGASIIDIMGAMFGVIAVQAALRERDDRPGRASASAGALFESAVFLMAHAHGRHRRDRRAAAADAGPPRRLGDLRGVPPPATASCSSASPATSNGRASSRSSACRTSPPIRASPPTSCAAGTRLADPGAARELIGKYSRRRWRGAANGRNVSWAPVGQPADLFEDAHLLAARRPARRLHLRLGGGGQSGRPAGPAGGIRRRPRSAPASRRQPPRMGEHNAEVLAEAGFSAAEIGRTRRAEGDRRPLTPGLLVHPDIFHAPAVVDAVHLHVRFFTYGCQHAARVEHDDRARRRPPAAVRSMSQTICLRFSRSVSHRLLVEHRFSISWLQ